VDLLHQCADRDCRHPCSPPALLRGRETPTARVPVDFVGIGLLALGIGSLQIMLDRGKDLDWFGSPAIVALAAVALVGLAFFVAWS